MDGRFGNENKPVDELIKKARWDTTMFVPIYDSEYKMCSVKTSVKKKLSKK